jgi:hypothetical protein
MKTMSSQIRILFIVLFVLVGVVATIFPYPVLTKFLFSIIWDYTFAWWSCTNRVVDITNLRIALTPTILVSVGLFFIIRKLGAVIDKNAYRFVRYISLVISWYCLIATALVMATMWFGLIIMGDETGIVATFGYVLYKGAIR